MKNFFLVRLLVCLFLLSCNKRKECCENYSFQFEGLLTKSKPLFVGNNVDTSFNPRIYFAYPPGNPTGFHNEGWFDTIDFNKNSVLYLNFKFPSKYAFYKFKLELDSNKNFLLTQTCSLECNCFSKINSGNPIEELSKRGIFWVIPKVDSTFSVNLNTITISRMNP